MTVRLLTKPKPFQGVMVDLPALRDRSQQAAIFDLSRGHPGINSLPRPDALWEM